MNAVSITEVPQSKDVPFGTAEGPMGLLSRNASQLGSEIVEVSGFIDEIDEKSHAQLKALHRIGEGSKEVITANSAVRAAVATMSKTCESTQTISSHAADQVQSAFELTQSFAKWVADLEERMANVYGQLDRVTASNADIARISKQVNILAVNAKIEAARAGDMGRGFAVVAEAINELSHKTATAASDITASVEDLMQLVGVLRNESRGVGDDARQVIGESQRTVDNMSQISLDIKNLTASAQMIEVQTDKVDNSVSSFAPAIEGLIESAADTTAGIYQTRSRMHSLVDRSEAIVQDVVSLGGSSEDQPFIDYVQSLAEKIGAKMEDAIKAGQITPQQLFDQTYKPIANSNPPQVMASFTKFTDQILPRWQEPALEFDSRVVFCAAVDTNGYLPTHNAKFSKPQGADPIWNAANARNRRIFDDRVGLKAGRNTKPFLLQVYRRDMGGGVYTMMKDLSAPIFVEGRHWGGLRLAYRI